MRSATALVIVLLAACRDTPTAPDGGLNVAVAASPTSIRAGQTTSISVTVTNRTSRARTIETNPCPPRFQIATPDGTVVGPGGSICNALSIQRTLQPGESFTFHRDWSGDTGSGLPGTTRTMLAPGTYYVVGYHDDNVRPDHSVPVQILP